MEAQLGDEVVEAEAGSWVFESRKQWHTFWYPGETSCHVIKVISPAGFETLLRDCRDVIGAPEVCYREVRALEIVSIDEAHDRYGF